MEVDSRRSLELFDVPGFGLKLSARVAERFPRLLDDPRLRRNPYLLATIPGIGFQRADTVALAMGVAPDSEFRIAAAAIEVLRAAESAGHSALPMALFRDRLAQMVCATVRSDLRIESPRVLVANGMFSLARTAKAEQAIADAVAPTLARGAPAYDLRFSAEGLFDDQKAALRAMHDCPIFILTGSPGTGKTSCIRAITDRADAKHIALCAPTGRAAKRIEEITGLAASTIHRLLKVVPCPDDHDKTEEGRHDARQCRLCIYEALPWAHTPSFKFRHHRNHPLEASMVVVDEASMIDVALCADLLGALAPGTRLLLVGDKFQLPSVGPGSVLRDLLAAGLPNVELTTLKRQDPNLLIARNCSAIRFEKRIIVNNSPETDFFFLECDDARRIAALAVEFHARRIPGKFGANPMNEIVTLTTLRERGALCAQALNDALRISLNPRAGTEMFPGIGAGDRVIQTRNDYDLDIMNGDLGVVEAAGVDSFRVAFDYPPRLVNIPRRA
jgi:exodeoxyribonuclease V alpha subunit